ncbi:hypothetical protein, partial [Caballeronia sp. ATUFL_M1_KS5A]|uniref:hypothetical protein n=1 Tax=Caballeronia sp. ATUFL_M1_KS5A TaxID=2921778 RepID=UPI0020277CEB
PKYNFLGAMNMNTLKEIVPRILKIRRTIRGRKKVELTLSKKMKNLEKKNNNNKIKNKIKINK